MRCYRARGVTGSCASNPPSLGGVIGTVDAAVAGTEDACIMPPSPACAHAAAVPSLAPDSDTAVAIISNVWSKSSQQAHSGGTAMFLMYFEESFRLQDNVIFCLIVLKLRKEIHCIYWIQEPNVMHTIMTFPTLKERNVVFLQDFLSWNIEGCNKSQCSIFCMIVPNLFQEVLHTL